MGPTVSGVVPADGATEVAIEANAEASFSEAVDPTTVTSSTFSLAKSSDGTPVSATVSYDPTARKATLNPEAELESKVMYTATLKGGAEGVKDPSGNPLAADVTWSFTTTATCTITGTPNGETLTGTTDDDVICAGGGSDTITGIDGNDILRGEGGADTLLGGIGDDTLDGGIGTDTASFSGSSVGISASLLGGSATGDGSDTLLGIESLLGSSLNDELTGSASNNTLNGAGGADTLSGQEGADTLTGAGGNDTLDSRDGVEGNDSLNGGVGTDTCTTDATEKSILNCEL
jgi:Ca2+-binding RTX toxin-like protein